MVKNVVRATLTNKKALFHRAWQSNGKQEAKLLTAPFGTKFLDLLCSVGKQASIWTELNSFTGTRATQGFLGLRIGSTLHSSSTTPSCRTRHDTHDTHRRHQIPVDQTPVDGARRGVPRHGLIRTGPVKRSVMAAAPTPARRAPGDGNGTYHRIFKDNWRQR